MKIEASALLVAGLLGLSILCGCGSGLGVDPVQPTPPTPAPPSAPPPVASQGGSVMVSPAYAAIGLGQSQAFHATINPSSGGSLVWSVNGIPGGNASVGTVDASGNYTAPSTLPNSLSTNFTVTAALSGSPSSNFATSVISVIVSGVVSSTTNPQVADYRIYLPAPGSAHVEFGPTTAYGFPTSSTPTPSANGGLVDTQVAGMIGSSEYHMRAQVTLADGATYMDTDQTFTTGATPPGATVTTTTTAGATPQPGIELFDTLMPHEPTAQAFATDLAGHVLWTYDYKDGSAADQVQPIKLLPNGHFLVQIAYFSTIPLKPAIASTLPQGTVDEIREIDLVGNTIRSVTVASLQPQLAALGYGSMQLGSLHHDVLPLTNGHMVLLVTQTKTESNLTGFSSPVNVLGDALLDVDQNGKVDWVWDAFAHLDVNRHPFQFPDWLHSNALLLTGDGNLLLSMRHQNWIIKIDFQNATGSGNVIWKLGYQGDFQLQGGVDPTDWFYAEHGPNFFTTNSTGDFKLGVFDNGNDRVFPSGVTCGKGGGPPCTYSSAQVYEVNEGAMTATLLDNYELPGQVYSFFGGNVDLLPNGNMEADFCAMPSGSIVQELSGAFGQQQVVWQATTPNTNQFRALRMGSLYPGVTW